MELAEGERTATRSLVLVAGSGRSGTSLFSGILRRLGFHVPQPEVPADETNPRGFSESQWVVDFHTRLLRRAGVQTSDARPGAWALTANVALDRAVQEELRTWLGTQFGEADHVVIKDPRLSWFLPLWQRCAEEVDVSPRFATVVRHPAAVVDSKQRSYGGWQGEISRTAGWLNQALFTERATREGGPRVFVRYEDLLDDWTRTVARVGEMLDLALIRDAPAASIVQIHEFVDRALSRSRPTWDDFDIPAGLREQADDVWELMSRLADGVEPDDRSIGVSLEAARAAYVAFYQDAEAVAQSSVTAAQRRGVARQGHMSLRVVRLVQRIPERYRRKVPSRWRTTVVRALNR
jgi:hypothetical protein